MITILRNARVQAPEALGERDIVIAGEKIAAIEARGVSFTGIAVDEIDALGRIVCPGFVDNHVHVLGGGGGLGFSSRAPELQTTQLVKAGITSVIGMLGFDATTRSMAALVARTKALREDGVSAFCLSGATLEHPVPTLTGRLRTDIAFVEEIIGVGEISISELGYGYDSFGAGAQYIAEAAVEGLLAGRLSRKAGYLCLQVPPYRDAVLKPMFAVLERTGIPITQFVPSHVNQTDGYMADALAWARRGGYIDVGANYSPANNYARATAPAAAIAHFLREGVPPAQILMSSDGNGAPPKEEKGENKPRVANYMPLSSLHAVWRQLVREEGVAAATALATVTENPARAAGLAGKGTIRAGADADLLVLGDDLEIAVVIARGRVMLNDGQPAVRGMFDATIIDELS